MVSEPTNQNETYENPWTYEGSPFFSCDIGPNVGFVYLITNITNNKKYIGKKTFLSIRRKKVKNKKNRVVKRSESDWKSYYGSSDLLKADIQLYGAYNFKREIIHLCKTKSLASYYEAREMFINDCLFSEDYYNTWISVRVHRTGVNAKT